MSDNAFSDNSQTTDNSQTQPASLDTLLANIKNENGEQKYKTLEDAIRALDASQRYIPELKNQLSGYQSKVTELEDKVGKFGNIEETVQRLLAQKTETSTTNTAASGLDEQAVMRLVQQSLEQRTAAEVADANFKLVRSKLIEQYGEKSGEVAASKAQELGTTVQHIEQLARQNPAMALALFQTTTHNDPVHTSGSRVTPNPVKVNVQAVKPQGKSLITGITDKERGSYFAELRKEVVGSMGYDV